MTPLMHIPNTLQQAVTGSWQGKRFSCSKTESLNAPNNRHMVLYNHCGTANTCDVAEGLTTALDFQKPVVSDVHEQGAQSVLTLE
jgi:hypothetical protein